METVLITGGTGLVGTSLSKKLEERGYKVCHLSRSPQKDSPYKTYLWNVYKGEIDPDAIETVDHIIHLAGANIGEKRWTKKRKQEIISSRVDGAKLICSKIKPNSKLKTLISASAVGYYGMITSAHIFIETDPPANDFLGTCCKLWEDASKEIENKNIRRVIIRTAIVFSPEGGAFEQMAKPFKYYAGSVLGPGNQYMPWIHIDDLCEIYLKALENTQMHGPYNAVSPQHVTNKEITKMLSSTLKKPVIFPPVPGFILKLVLGEMAEALLTGSRVSSEKIIDAGFTFKKPELSKCLFELSQ